MKQQSFLLVAIVEALAGRVFVNAFLPLPSCTLQHRNDCLLPQRRSSVEDNEWSVTDDWNGLSYENPRNSASDTSDIFNQDAVRRVAMAMEMDFTRTKPSQEDIWMKDTLDQIQAAETLTMDRIEPQSDKTTGGTSHTERFIDQMGQEIALLVRCNESPQDMLVSQGRALPPLSDEERNDPKQLVTLEEEENSEGSVLVWKATPFLRQAVSTMFQEHCSPVAATGDETTVNNSKLDEPAGKSVTSSSDPIMVLGAAGIASWMTKALGSHESLGPVSQFDPRVTSTVSVHGTYGKGYLTQADFQNLYLKAIVGITKHPIKNGSTTSSSVSALWQQLYRRRKQFIDSAWRDMRHYGIRSPVEVQREQLLEEMLTNRNSELSIQIDHDADTLLDECEILDDATLATTSYTTDQEGAASHEEVVLAPDKKTPLWMKDGDFVFIDEESCIGCMQCASAAPACFRMIENGRARTFAQRKSPEVGIAVSTCPVDCMKYVSFDELKELETARDHGDGRDDHRHFGHSASRGYVGRIPLHVSGIDSDANHRSSWYHYLKNKCHVSQQCPQRGCFDCPTFSEKGKNPYFQERLRKANHVRAEYFITTGIADPFRKAADL